MENGFVCINVEEFVEETWKNNGAREYKGSD